MTLLLIYAFGALSVSFFCSLLEASLLSSRLVTLVERKKAGDRGAELLLDIKEHRLDDAISSILTLNTIANTIGATLAGAQAKVVFGDNRLIGVVTAVGVFTASLSLGVLIFSEIIPKTLGAVYASRLIGFVGRAVAALIWLLKPFLLLTRLITRLLTPAGKLGTGISRSELVAMIGLAAREGALPLSESRVLDNVLRYNEIKVDDVMTPRTVIAMLPEDTPVRDFLRDEESRVFSRIPLYRGDRDDVTGYVLQREVLSAAARDDLDSPLARFKRPALFLPEGQPVGRVLRRMIEQREHLALVTDEYGGVSGLVTLEDLVETILGVEILDEYDRVADLRAEAAKLRQQRLEAMRRFHQPRAQPRAQPREQPPAQQPAAAAERPARERS
ncbi:MAG: DUF21 domain-containing protein [Acidobacteria bacterium]|nr:MAG: DUF21 domain-containing protein [Acidobacteriota bacterium]